MTKSKNNIVPFRAYLKHAKIPFPTEQSRQQFAGQAEPVHQTGTDPSSQHRQQRQDTIGRLWTVLLPECVKKVATDTRFALES